MKPCVSSPQHDITIVEKTRIKGNELKRICHPEPGEALLVISNKAES